MTDNQLIQRAVDYMKFLRQTLPTIALNRTLLMDETAVYFEDCRTQTIDFEGRRHVIIKSTGFSSMCITACVLMFQLLLKITNSFDNDQLKF